MARIQRSSVSNIVRNQVAEIGELVCNSDATVDIEPGLLNYASTVTQLDIKVLEQIREELCRGLDSLECIPSNEATVRPQTGQI